MKYEKGKMPWDYEDSVFKTVCKDCHLIYEDFKGTDYLLLKSTTTRTINCMKIVAVHVETDDDDKKLEFIYLFSINREDQTCEVYHILHFSEIETINEMISLGRVRNVG